MVEIDYLNLCKRILNDGTNVFNERTGKSVRTVINADLVYDVGAGEFPLITTRKAYWKSAIAEMIGYMRGYTNAQNFADLGTPTWFANANDNASWLANPHRKGEDDMGLAYRFRGLMYGVERSSIFKSKPKLQYLPRFPKVHFDYNQNKYGYVGEIWESNNSGYFQIIKEHTSEDKGNELFYDIQFCDSGYIKKSCRISDLKRGEVKDLYSPTFCRVACLGETTGLDKDLLKLLKPIWNNMIGRCYEDSQRSEFYEDFWVSDRWLVFSNFVQDFKKIPNWELKLIYPEDYSLDKDISGSNYYSVETCRWASRAEQNANKCSIPEFEYQTDGSVGVFKGIKLFERQFGIAGLGYQFDKHGNQPFKYKGFTFKKLPPKNNVAMVEKDQLKLIYAKLKLGIDDRGLIMTAWQPHTFEFSCLRPCMHSYQFSILNDELHLHATQRSCDVPLGLTFNMVQVYFLLYIMAKVTGLKAGKAYHKIVNAHIYEDQISLMKEQVKRIPFESPEFGCINPNINTLEDLLQWVTPDDFGISGYRHHEPIQYPFSV